MAGFSTLLLRRRSPSYVLPFHFGQRIRSVCRSSLIDRFHEYMILDAFFAGRVRFAVIQDAVRHVIDLERKLILLAETDLIDGLRLTIAVRNPELLALVSECILELKTCSVRVNVKVPRFVHAITRGTICDDAVREAQGERHSLFHFAEAGIVRRRRNSRIDLDWLFACQTTRSVEAVDSDIRSEPPPAIALLRRHCSGAAMF